MFPVAAVREATPFGTEKAKDARCMISENSGMSAANCQPAIRSPNICRTTSGPRKLKASAIRSASFILHLNWRAVACSKHRNSSRSAARFLCTNGRRWKLRHAALALSALGRGGGRVPFAQLPMVTSIRLPCCLGQKSWPGTADVGRGMASGRPASRRTGRQYWRHAGPSDQPQARSRPTEW